MSRVCEPPSPAEAHALQPWVAHRLTKLVREATGDEWNVDKHIARYGLWPREDPRKNFQKKSQTPLTGGAEI